MVAHTTTATEQRELLQFFARASACLSIACRASDGLTGGLCFPQALMQLNDDVRALVGFAQCSGLRNTTLACCLLPLWRFCRCIRAHAPFVPCRERARSDSKQACTAHALRGACRRKPRRADGKLQLTGKSHGKQKRVARTAGVCSANRAAASTGLKVISSTSAMTLVVVHLNWYIMHATYKGRIEYELVQARPNHDTTRHGWAA
jgi:hypothetical protein